MEAIKVIPEKKKKIDWDYDEEADVLYLSFEKPRPSIGVDMGEGVILRYDEEKGEITGLTIIGIRSALMQAIKRKKRR